MNLTKTAQTAATKSKLEAIARALFSERGFEAVSAEELVAKAKVTRGALYHHYNGKEGLFAAVVETMMRELHAELARERPDSPIPCPRCNAVLPFFSKPAPNRTYREYCLSMRRRSLAGKRGAKWMRSTDWVWSGPPCRLRWKWGCCTGRMSTFLPTFSWGR